MNIGAATTDWTLLYSDARDGTPFASIYGNDNTLSLAGNAAQIVDVDTSEGTVFQPTAGMDYFVAQAEVPALNYGSNQPGYLLNLVTSQQSGTIDNMTTVCGL